ncbi:hypothetical protein COU78_04605 [Candidatus Peregrinibacteria bacterium CG10_big_fil_rev_8_21_14_0_10_49_24]|nr:MAG: hypothetical protein COV83_06630 [Candidatus Peregrinibacteria bacterium CG11_big_fil_rev_8_21_14_0_20_49_14]PIR50801.1 MAG: hypothetical protein COU78_04605 [Candidatus Peregrinibacteria bacterium CG10_big_fil_rev_8_21_14_0_10_49_24]PJA67793.1 MAG: hypothetical protein CO157_02700 [Candidatus Peregrinibacteria bacterium CG_4_9_14_3_um_filter_49_12]
MDKHLSSFFEAAKKVSLTESERSNVRDALVTQVTALEVHLSAQEREEVRAVLMQHVSVPLPEEYVGAAARDVRLSALEKEAVFDRVHAFMQMHPARRNQVSTLSSRLDATRAALLRPFTLRSFSAQFLIVSILVTTGGGFAYAAEDTLPGDALYPLKVDVTEPLREYFSLSQERRVERALHHLNRRFEEAEMLLQRERVLPEHQALLEQHIEERMAHMEERLQLLSERDAQLASDVSERWEFAVEDHESGLRKFMEHGHPDHTDFPAFARVRDWREQAFRTRHFAEARAASSVSPEDIEDILKEHLKAVREVATTPVVEPEIAEYLRENMEQAESFFRQGNVPEAYQAMRRGKRAFHRTMEGRQFIPELRGDTSVFEHMKPPPFAPELFEDMAENKKEDHRGLPERSESEREEDNDSHEMRDARRGPPPLFGGTKKEALRPPFKEHREDPPHVPEEEERDADTEDRDDEDKDRGRGRDDRDDREHGRGRGGPPSRRP